MEPGEPLPILDGKYQLLRLLGEGGMGAVYEGRHQGTGRRVAVKVIAGAAASNVEVVRRFQREAMASGSLDSQHIAQVLDTGVDPASGRPYLVMELLAGEDVQGAIERLGPFPPDLALRVIAQACLGLQKAHAAQVVHRDIKPANLFLARREGTEIHVKLLDFGIAKATGGDPLSASANHSTTRTGAMLGSPIYMSPEQATGRKTIDHRTDIWSLGVVLYEALCGRTPHGHAETIGELIIRICGEAPQPVQEHAPWIPPEVAAVAHRAMALDPAARFQSAAEMLAAIRALLPAGHALDEAMFVPLTTQARSIAAPRWSLTSGMRAPAPSLPGMSQSNPDLALFEQARITASSLGRTKSTTDGFGQSEGSLVPPPKRSRAILIAVASVLGLGVAGASFVALRGPHTTAASPPPPQESSVAPPSTASAAPSPPATGVAQIDPAPAPTEPAAVTPQITNTKPARSRGPHGASAAPVASSRAAPSPPPPASPTPAAPAPPPASHPAPAVTPAPPPAASAPAAPKYNPLDHL